MPLAKMNKKDVKMRNRKTREGLPVLLVPEMSNNA